MTKLNSLSQLDETAREDLADLLEKMAKDAAELMAHAVLPVSIELLNVRRTIYEEAVTALRAVEA